MAVPVVAIVGRPNVGKSTLFNYLSGKKISIVDDRPNVTRDRIYTDAEWRGKKFRIIDTGGIDPYTEDKIMQQVKKQAELAIDTADVIIFITDIKEGVTPSDIEVANALRKTRKPVLLVVNKVDNIGNPPDDIYEFYNLGLGEPLSISASHGLGIGELLDSVYEAFPEIDDTDEDDDRIKIAVIGKPNSGKSSLVNKILGEERVIVSDIPGTTRDAIDTFMERDGQKYTLIDTAGLRKKSKVYEDIERYSIIRSLSAIERADVCLIMIDAQDGVTEQDTKIAGYAHEQGKASIIIINKWDLIDKETGTLEEYRKRVYERLGYMLYAPVHFISAKTGQRVEKILELVKYVSNQNATRISTGMLNDVINEAIAIVQPPSDKGKRLKILYGTQVDIKPPTFALFVNDSELMHYSYERYIENQLRKNFGFEGTPLRFLIREKEE